MAKSKIDLMIFRGTWKILDDRGKFVAWATGTINDAILLAKEFGITSGEFIPCESMI